MGFLVLSRFAYDLSHFLLVLSLFKNRSMGLKVLVLSAYSDSVSQRPEVNLLKGLHERGIRVDVMTRTKSKYLDEFKSIGMRVINYYPVKKIHLAGIKKLRTLIKEEKYDVIHLFNSRAAVNGIIAAIGLPVKVVLYRGFMGHVNWYDPSSYFKYLSPRVDRIMCISKGVCDLLKRQRWFDRKAPVLIHKGHHPDWYAPIEKAELSEAGIPDNAFKVVAVANYRPVKGIRYFLEASYHIPGDVPVHFIVVGKGFDNPDIQKLIKNSPLKNQIHLLGYRLDVLNIVKASDVFVLPSLNESTPKSLIEAMSLGIPSISTNIKGTEEMLFHEKNGLRIPVKDGKSIAEAIIRLCHNPGMRQTFSKEGLHTMQTVFHIDRTIEQVKAMYEEISERN
jgi:glycosyltransferase involved in cell wall biosynthesis